MGRIRMVTRTVKVTECLVLSLDIESQQTAEIKIQLSGLFKGNKRLMLEACRKVADTERIKVVALLHFTEYVQLYGMTEQKFIQVASTLDHR